MKDMFSSYHPAVNFIYFAFIIIFGMVFMHPVCLGISFTCALTYLIYIRGIEVLKGTLIFMFSTIALTSVINGLFIHEGVTIIFYLYNDNPVTLESLIYGVAAAVMISTAGCWFSCYNAVMSSDKFVYLFGRIIPSLSLVFSMVLRFVPKFKAQLKKVSNCQRYLGKDISRGSILERVRHGINILSALFTWALENAVDTSDSMKARGYGMPGRTSFSIYKWHKRDKAALGTILFLGSFILLGGINGKFYFSYYPLLKGNHISFAGLIYFVLYGVLGFAPIIINLWEAVKWKLSQLKI